DFAQPRNVALVGIDAVSVWFRSVCCFGQRVADTGMHTRVAAIADLCLKSVVVGVTEVRQNIDLAHAAIDWQYRARGIGSSHGSNLSRCGAIKWRRSIQINRASKIAPVLMDVVA